MRCKIDQRVRVAELHISELKRTSETTGKESGAARVSVFKVYYVARFSFIHFPFVAVF